MILVAEITRTDAGAEWHSDCATPRFMDAANAWEPGWYACDADGGESGNAYAWDGPHANESEAIAAVGELAS